MADQGVAFVDFLNLSFVFVPQYIGDTPRFVFDQKGCNACDEKGDQNPAYNR